MRLQKRFWAPWAKQWVGKKFKTVMAVFLALAFLLAPTVMVVEMVSAATGLDSATGLLERSSKKSFGSENAATSSGIVERLVNRAVGVLGVVAIVLIVYAGGMWLTAAGNPEKVKKAQKVIISTVVGVIIVGLAYAITAFILGQVVVVDEQQASAPTGGGGVVIPGGKILAPGQSAD